MRFQRQLAQASDRRISLKYIHENPTVRGLIGPHPPAGAEEPDTGPGPDSVVTLYYLPYAGSSARIYTPWEEWLPSGVRLVPLELPGRGARWSEPAKSGLGGLLDDLAGGMGEARQAPYALFGHSFGGILAFELARRLRSLGFPSPQRLLVSGCPAPRLAAPAENTYDLPAEEFIHRLRQLRGTPEELLENDELMELYIPVIRADYTILDTYVPPEDDPLDCPITAFYGKGDEETGRSAVEAWSAYGTGSFAIEEIPGDHFFLRDSQTELPTRLTRYLEDSVPREAVL